MNETHCDTCGYPISQCNCLTKLRRTDAGIINFGGDPAILTNEDGEIVYNISTEQKRFCRICHHPLSETDISNICNICNICNKTVGFTVIIDKLNTIIDRLDTLIVKLDSTTKK